MMERGVDQKMGRRADSSNFGLWPNKIVQYAIYLSTKIYKIPL